LKHGTDTGGSIRLWNFKIDSPNVIYGRKYQATDGTALERAVDVLRGDRRRFTFVDLGCGKGRALLVAARMGFGRVVGVEFARELVDVARDNLIRMGVANGTVIAADAAEYRLEEVMQKVVDNLASVASKRAVYVIYENPECAALFDRSAFLTRVDYSEGAPSIQIWKSKQT
jgi:SAM-dependent methyltransferase